MKDGSRTISERATRFLPVDMKDRLKSAFNRNSSSTAPHSARADEAADYNAIFNVNLNTPAPASPRFADQLANGPQLSEGLHSATLRKNPSRQVAQDIEEGEIVTESGPDPSASPRKFSVEEVVDYSVTLKSAQSKTTDGRRARRQIESSSQAQPADTEHYRPHSEPEANYDSSKNGEPVSQKSKSRFFGDFSSTESVRLKVEKRNDKRPEPAPMVSKDDQPATPDSRLAEVTVLGAERGAVPVFALADDPQRLLANGHNPTTVTTEGLAAEPAASEQAHINLLEEFDSMDAKEHESENGVAVQSEGGPSAATIVIERNSKFSGQLKFSGAITIEGQVEGELIADRIVVQEGGLVVASVDGNTVVIAGNVTGDVRAHGELEILPSGVVDGSVTAPAITVRRGGRVEGRCTIGVPRA